MEPALVATIVTGVITISFNAGTIWFKSIRNEEDKKDIRLTMQENKKEIEEDLEKSKKEHQEQFDILWNRFHNMEQWNDVHQQGSTATRLDIEKQFALVKVALGQKDVQFTEILRRLERIDDKLDKK